jgi:retron-type reverse transcriptase
MRLSPLLNAFIQKWSIHDNFLYVQRVIRKLHKSGQPALFVKLDISKAFDSLNWAYLLDVLKSRGFPP